MVMVRTRCVLLTLADVRTRTSMTPPPRGELTVFFIRTWDLMVVLEGNFDQGLAEMLLVFHGTSSFLSRLLPTSPTTGDRALFIDQLQQADQSLRNRSTCVFSKAATSLVKARRRGRTLPALALRDAVNFPAGLCGPVDLLHGDQVRISSACRFFCSGVHSRAAMSVLH